MGANAVSRCNGAGPLSPAEAEGHRLPEGLGLDEQRVAEGGGGLGVLPGRSRPALPQTARLSSGLALLRAVGILDGACPLNPGGRGWGGAWGRHTHRTHCSLRQVPGPLPRRAR